MLNGIYVFINSLMVLRNFEFQEDGKVSSEEEEGGSRAPSAGASSDGSLR